MTTKLKYYDLKKIENEITNYEDLILYVFAATRYATIINTTREQLPNALNIKLRNPSILKHLFRYRSHNTIESIYKPGTPYNTVNQKVLFANIDIFPKVQMIKLAAMLTTEQHWRINEYRLTIPLAIGEQYLHNEIPKSWYTIKNKLIYLNIEENNKWH